MRLALLDEVELRPHGGEVSGMIAVDSGLGYLVIDSRNSGKRYDLVVAAMLIIGVIGLALDVIFRQVEKIRSVRWGFRS